MHERNAKLFEDHSSKVVFDFGQPRSSVFSEINPDNSEAMKRLMNERVKEILFENEAHRLKM